MCSMRLETTYRALRCALILLVIAAGLCRAQGSGTIQGVITDSSGAVVEGAAVQITNNATGVVKTSVTNGDGRYVVPFLSPGHYAVSVERTGFTTARRADVLL